MNDRHYKLPYFLLGERGDSPAKGEFHEARGGDEDRDKEPGLRHRPEAGDPGTRARRDKSQPR